jgi:hypothetical protein
MGTFKGTVTRNSNGTVEIRAFDDANVPREMAMGSEVEVNFNVLRTVDEIEAANSKSKNRPAPQPAATSTPATSTAPANATAATTTTGGKKTTSRTQTTG